jgi:hypothetical protein
VRRLKRRRARRCKPGAAIQQLSSADFCANQFVVPIGLLAPSVVGAANPQFRNTCARWLVRSDERINLYGKADCGHLPPARRRYVI